MAELFATRQLKQEGGSLVQFNCSCLKRRIK
jgi:hypothetical protein